ncbi:methyl-accepting chemotaxis protein [Pseudomonas sp. HMWF032]|uniref:methyl-accepting chemotaxis protein n=1 Tax=unclassified Pseudomonas TaxID=196821 RepID=UPI000D346D56|nr:MULTISPECIES: methyl-accepting chemotaxis protein [unclassified Pseudomonas]PTS86857.1 methyl-accepting chemotaxis protein [Pseudomonas sp. HMWF032]PTT82447.1 methyl-accepting chemotaxis protein [Pseudomonas sp. HMWF010]WAC44521.1 methyl-accepting chemotaxis protein [Pseudomonas sp. SL4(2022)]
MNIRQKMIACGVISVLAASLLGCIGFWGQTRLASALNENQLSISALRNHLEGDMMHDALRSDVLAAFYIDPNDSTAATQLRKDLREHSEWFTRTLNDNAKLPLSDAIRQAVSQSQPALAAYIQQAESIVDLALKDPQEARRHMPDFDTSFAELEEKNEALSGLIEAHSANARSDSQAAVKDAAWLLVGGILLVCCLLTLLTGQLMRAVLRPLETVVNVARAIAQGNLRNVISVDSDDEAGQLQQALADMQNNLRKMIDEIRAEGEQLQQTAHSLNGASQSIVYSANEGSQNATSMACAMEQMIQNIGQIAGHARNAQEISSQSEHLASSGGQVIMGVVDGMSRIAEAVNESSATITALGQSSEEIHSIIQVIKSIAEQTNLLALNAAIEAARAGEAGRGFAVVADEVRNLAARTAQSTQEITQMIERIRSSTSQAVDSMQTGVTRVNDGVSLARQAGESINEIRGGAHRAAEVVEEISQTINEQSKASNEVALRVEHIAQMSQQNSRTVNELAAATQSLDRVARSMQSAVLQFQT